VKGQTTLAISRVAQGVEQSEVVHHFKPTGRAEAGAYLGEGTDSSWRMRALYDGQGQGLMWEQVQTVLGECELSRRVGEAVHDEVDVPDNAQRGSFERAQERLEIR